jgi:hypothetical protein
MARHPAGALGGICGIGEQYVRIAGHRGGIGNRQAFVMRGISVDPLRMVGKELKFLTKNIRQLLGSGHPALDKVAKYYTHSEGKHSFLGWRLREWMAH